MIRPRRAALAQSVQQFFEKHAFGFDPRDHAQPRLSSAIAIRLDLIAPTRLVLGLGLSAASNAPIEPTKFGLFRM
jgi:hypothetical protein